MIDFDTITSIERTADGLRIEYGSLRGTKVPDDHVDFDAIVEQAVTLGFLEQSAPSLDYLKTRQVNLLSTCCGASIVGSYQSAALGELHTYPSSVNDQINMMGSVTASLLPGLADGWETPFWCADADGTWGYRMHSASAIQLAGSDGKAHVVACQTRLAALTAEVAAATTSDVITAIVWPAN